MNKLTKIIKNTPVIGRIILRARQIIRNKKSFFPGSNNYWENRYSAGGTSGPGSYNKLAIYKAAILNSFIEKKHISRVIEFGCGDGNQLTYSQYPTYLGYDVSPTAIQMCRERFKHDVSKRFQLVTEYNEETAEVVLSLDVVYHLVEDDIYEEYMYRLFKAAERFVVIYSSNTDENPPYHEPYIRHRKFTDWVDKNLSEWILDQHIPNDLPFLGNTMTGSFADFYIYRRKISGE